MLIRLRIGLLGRVALAIVVGALLGYVMPSWLIRFCATVSSLFGSFLGFAVPLIIVGLVTAAIASIGSQAKRLLVATALLAYGFTVASGLVAYAVGTTIFPSLVGVSSSLSDDVGVDVSPLIEVDIPPLMSVMTALIFSFIVGLGIASTKSQPLRRAADDFALIINRMIQRVIIPCLPFYIFCIFAQMAYSGQVVSVLLVFLKIIGVIFVLHYGILLMQYCVAALAVRRNPLSMLWNMLPAYLTALGTQSSAATIPVTLRCVLKNGVSDAVARFVVPLCATIHLSGSTMKIVACSIALMLMRGMDIDAPQMLQFILLLAVTMVAAPGVPGGAIMAALGVLQSVLGFDADAQALMIALYIAMDSFGTACNVTGDGAIAMLIDRVAAGHEPR